MSAPPVAAAEVVTAGATGAGAVTVGGPAAEGVVAAWACPPEWVTAGTTR
jgi:hypothetical protein